MRPCLWNNISGNISQIRNHTTMMIHIIIAITEEDFPLLTSNDWLCVDEVMIGDELIVKSTAAVAERLFDVKMSAFLTPHSGGLLCA